LATSAGPSGSTAAELRAYGEPGAAAGQDGGEATARLTFQDILANPNDPNLTFRYAQQQVADGDLKGAVGSLDRMLIQNPQLNEVRLFYAIVLYRLDDIVEAEAELARIDVEALPPGLKAEHGRYSGLIGQRKQATRYNASLGVGFEYDTNATAAPASGTVAVLGFPLGVAGSVDDFGFIGTTSLGFLHDLGRQQEADLAGQVTLYANEQASVAAQSNHSASGRLGAIFRTSFAELSPYLEGGNLWLSHDQFYTFGGVSLRAVRRIHQRFSGEVRLRYRYEDFDPIAESLTASDRTGHRYDVSAGGTYRFAPGRSFNFSATYTRKSAAMAFEAYEGISVDGALIVALFDRHFLQVQLSGGIRGYDAMDPFIGLLAREDQYLRARFAYGVPVAAFLASAPSILADIHLIPAFEIYRQQSNLPNFDFNNYKVSLMITKRFEF
jgi:hypothetical protein